MNPATVSSSEFTAYRSTPYPVARPLATDPATRRLVKLPGPAPHTILATSRLVTPVSAMHSANAGINRSPRSVRCALRSSPRRERSHTTSDPRRIATLPAYVEPSIAIVMFFIRRAGFDGRDRRAHNRDRLEDDPGEGVRPHAQATRRVRASASTQSRPSRGSSAALASRDDRDRCETPLNEAPSTREPARRSDS